MNFWPRLRPICARCLLGHVLAVIRKRAFLNFGRPAHFHGSGVYPANLCPLLRDERYSWFIARDQTASVG
jgi:hypothetical protein